LQDQQKIEKFVKINERTNFNFTNLLPDEEFEIYFIASSESGIQKIAMWSEI